jgi:hypothetical protein
MGPTIAALDQSVRVCFNVGKRVGGSRAGIRRAPAGTRRGSRMNRAGTVAGQLRISDFRAVAERFDVEKSSDTC